MYNNIFLKKATSVRVAWTLSIHVDQSCLKIKYICIIVIYMYKSYRNKKKKRKRKKKMVPILLLLFEWYLYYYNLLVFSIS